MQGSKVRAVLDWEFSDAYPLSELVGGVGIDVLEVIDDDSEEDDYGYGRRNGEAEGLDRKEGRDAVWRSWHSDPVVGHARMEMFLT